MKPLRLYDRYSREDVHGIFDPDTTFTPQSGTWGLHGFVSIPKREGDYVFFVTYGQKQGAHVFDEGVTREGVLSWQSQPRQDLNNKGILQWISHDEFKNSIYLFLRTNNTQNYTYLGKLKYLSHDLEREKPVYFQWQILDWDIDKNVLDDMYMELEEVKEGSPALESSNSKGLVVEDPPKISESKGIRTKTFQSSKKPDYSQRESLNKELGLKGELCALDYEKEFLVKNNRSDLVERVVHVSDVEGDGAGYDIRSYDLEGEVKYIEVKTTKGNNKTPFFMSSNEVQFSNSHISNYYIYRLYNFDAKSSSAKMYVTQGSVVNEYSLVPISFKVEKS
jgi:hypothetical protein